MSFNPLLRYKRTFCLAKNEKFNWIKAISTSNCDKHWKLLHQLNHNTWVYYKSLIYYCVLHLICQMNGSLCVLFLGGSTIVSSSTNFNCALFVCSTNIIVAIISYDTELLSYNFHCKLIFLVLFFFSLGIITISNVSCH